MARLVLDEAPEAGVEVGPIVAAPADVSAWLAVLLRERLGAGETLHIEEDRTVASRAGWPCRMVRGRVAPSDDRLVVVVYRLLDHVAAVRARGLSVEDAALLSGRPDWSGPEVAAVHELWT